MLCDTVIDKLFYILCDWRLLLDCSLLQETSRGGSWPRLIVEVVGDMAGWTCRYVKR